MNVFLESLSLEINEPSHFTSGGITHRVNYCKSFEYISFNGIYSNDKEKKPIFRNPIDILRLFPYCVINQINYYGKVPKTTDFITIKRKYTYKVK